MTLMYYNFSPFAMAYLRVNLFEHVRGLSVILRWILNGMVCFSLVIKFNVESYIRIQLQWPTTRKIK